MYLPPIKVQIPASNKQQNQVTAAERNQDAQVAPPRIETNRQRLVELISNTIRTVRAVRRGVIGDIASAVVREEGLHVLAAGLAFGRCKEVKLRGGTSDGLAMQLS